MKQKKDPYKQGSIKEIAELMIKPLISAKPKQMSIKGWLEKIFNVDTRDISRWRVKKPFYMIGLHLVTANKKVAGVKHRKMKRNALLWVRTDDHTPDVIEVEVSEGKGIPGKVFELCPEEWNVIEPYVRKLQK